MNITTESNYQQLLDEKEIIIDKRTEKEFVLYTPVGMTQDVRKDIAEWYFKENNIPLKRNIDKDCGHKKIWMNGKNWRIAEFELD